MQEFKQPQNMSKPKATGKKNKKNTRDPVTLPNENREEVIEHWGDEPDKAGRQTNYSHAHPYSK